MTLLRLDAKLYEPVLFSLCYCETQLDVHIPHSLVVGGQSAPVCPKGKGVGEVHSGFTRQHAVAGMVHINTSSN